MATVNSRIVVLVLVAMNIAVCEQRVVTVRHVEDDFTSEVTFDPDGSCSINGHLLPEVECHRIGREYDTRRSSPARSQVEMRQNGDCLVEGDMAMTIHTCREYLGEQAYDRLYQELYPLPDAEIDDSGYCHIGDRTLAPDECEFIIGHASYTVLLSRSTYAAVKR